MMIKQKQLVWFRSDLRVSDNPALHHAAKAGLVAGVYLLFSEQWRQHQDSQNKLWFRMQNLAALKKSLSALNIPLIILKLDYFDDAPEALMELIRQISFKGLWFNREYGINERRRDQQVKALLQSNGVPCYASVDQTLFIPGSVLNGQGEFFKVFTPFKKKLYAKLSSEQLTPLPAPAPQAEFPVPAFPVIDINQLYEPTATLISPDLIAGEQQAHHILKQFIEERSDDYKELRDIPSVNGTSRISTWLVAGVISIRQCFYVALQANNGELDTSSDGLACWMSELIWREFYQHILYGFPRVSMHRAFKVATERLPWRQDVDLLQAWQQGETGFPLVDAAMKQLVQTGWMHNRLRMLTAMFLSKNLMLDWRLGESFFMEHLLDGDLAANNGGWQWSASTGTDAAPYFRMFNPVSQSQKFDPKGIFIRQWLPQLKHLDNKTIHAPWQYKERVPGYPPPVVDLKLSRARVIEVFQLLKNSQE